MSPVNRVAIVGGTHGNELTGVYLIKKFLQFPSLVERSEFDTLTVLANPKAYELGRRYVETDLNRCFRTEDLENPQLVQYEQLLAKAIYRQLRASQVDFLIEIHSSTANMGLTLLLSNEHPFNLQLAAFLSNVDPSIRILKTGVAGQNGRLRDQFKFGLTIEVGPVAQGIVSARVFEKTEQLIFEILDYLAQPAQLSEAPSRFILFSAQQAVDFPRTDHGEIAGMIHPELEGADYQPIQFGHPLFLKFDGSVETYQGQGPVYPVFINESAYLEKGIAFYLATQQEIVVPSHAVENE